MFAAKLPTFASFLEKTSSFLLIFWRPYSLWIKLLCSLTDSRYKSIYIFCIFNRNSSILFCHLYSKKLRPPSRILKAFYLCTMACGRYILSSYSHHLVTIRIMEGSFKCRLPFMISSYENLVMESGSFLPIL